MRLTAYKKELYELRYSPMCKPAGEVANLTQLESHTTRARMIMFWRIAEGYLAWGPREVGLLYESTLDSISEAFDVFHYPVSRYMLDARADVWNSGLAPENVQRVVSASLEHTSPAPPVVPPGGALLLAGEIAQFSDKSLKSPLEAALDAASLDAPVWIAPTGSLAYALGARQAAQQQALAILDGIEASGARSVIADGPETAWALLKVFPDLGLTLPEGLQVELLSQALAERLVPARQDLGAVFFHDSRPAYFLAESLPNHLAVLPGFTGEASAFGAGPAYEAPRRLLDALGATQVHGSWQRGLAKSCGADDGLWRTHPRLAAGLAQQRLDYAKSLGAQMVVSDSPLCAAWLAKNAREGDPAVHWLAKLLAL